MKRQLLVLIAALTSTTAFASVDFETFGSSIDEKTYAKHFTISDGAENLSDAPVADFQDPTELLMKTKHAIQAAAVSLTNWIEHEKTLARPRNPYNRGVHFGKWRKDPSNKTCLDVRGMILEKTSEVPIKTRVSADRCVVVSGKWTDPYSGKVFRTPFPDVEIDHMVPLKNAYLMGASKWSSKKRCWFANYFKSDFHLLAVSAHENEVKSDATPYDYLPSKSEYHCQYVKNWLKIKLLWNLAMVPPEVEAIETVIKENRCSLSEMQMTAYELRTARAQIELGSPYCDMDDQDQGN